MVTKKGNRVVLQDPKYIFGSAKAAQTMIKRGRGKRSPLSKLPTSLDELKQAVKLDDDVKEPPNGSDSKQA